MWRRPLEARLQAWPTRLDVGQKLKSAGFVQAYAKLLLADQESYSPDSPTALFVMDPTVWTRGGSDPECALIILNQPLQNTSRLTKLGSYCAYTVLADGAANQISEILELGLRVDAVIGDGDSITDGALKILATNDIEFIRDTDQYASDFMKALRLVKKSRPDISKAYAVGALGGRVDHSWHSMFCLTFAKNLGLDIFLLSSMNVTFGVDGDDKPHVIQTPRSVLGKACGFFPLNGPTKMTIRGLQWDVTDWDTSAVTRMSTSNYLVADEISVQANQPMAVTLELK